MLFNYIKRSVCNSLTYAVGSLITKFISLIFLPRFLSILTLEELGIWDFYQSIISFGMLLFSSAASLSLSRFYFYYQDDPVNQKKAMGNAFFLVLFGACLVVPFFLFIFKFLHYDVGSDSYLFIAILNISSASIFSFLLGYYRTKECRSIYLFLLISQSIICLVLSVAGLYFGYGVKVFLYSSFISSFICLPMFIKRLIKYCSLSFSILKDQIIYTFPVVIYGVLFGFFFVMDKAFIKQNLGYDVLGSYALLWRFGTIYIFFTTPLLDSFGIAVFDAQKKQNGNYLISKIISYFYLIILGGTFISCFCSYVAVKTVFPEKFLYIIQYIPLFFLSIMTLDMIRFIQIFFGLSKKTFFHPIVVIMSLIIQFIFLHCFVSFSLYGVLVANAISFILSIVFIYFIGVTVYSSEIIEVKRILKSFLTYLLFVGSYQFCIFYGFSMFLFWGVLAIFLSVIFWKFNIVDYAEKKWLLKRFGIFQKALFVE